MLRRRTVKSLFTEAKLNLWYWRQVIDQSATLNLSASISFSCRVKNCSRGICLEVLQCRGRSSEAPVALVLGRIGVCHTKRRGPSLD
jgi:hypothetical protein